MFSVNQLGLFKVYCNHEQIGAFYIFLHLSFLLGILPISHWFPYSKSGNTVNFLLGYVSLFHWHLSGILIPQVCTVQLFCSLGFHIPVLDRGVSLASSLLSLKIHLRTRFYHIFFSFVCFHSSSSLISSTVLTSAPVHSLENPKLASTYFIAFGTENGN